MSDRYSYPTLSLVFAAALAAGCGGGSGNGNGQDPANGEDDEIVDNGENGDDDDIAGDPGQCDAEVAIASGSGLDTDAGFEPLNHFYAFGDKLCGFLPSTGEGFEVDDGLVPEEGGGDVEVPIWSADTPSGGGLADVEVERVVYTADGEIRYARTTTGIAGDPDQGRISNEDEALDITQMRVAFNDTSGLDRIAYLKRDDGWYSVTVGGGDDVDPAAFDDQQAPLGALYDLPGIGGAIGWLVHDGSSGTLQALQVNDLDNDLYGEEALVDGLPSTPGLGVAVQAQFEDSTAVVSATAADQLTFYHIDPTEGEASDAATDLGTVAGETVNATASRDSTLFATVNAGDRSRLYRIDDSGVAEIDQGESGSDALFVVPTDDRVVWSWTGADQAQVVSLGHDGNNRQELASRPSDDGGFGTTVTGSADNWVFFNEVGFGGETPDDFVLRAYAVDALDATERLFEGAQWQGASNTSDIFVITPAGGHEVSEVFLVETDPNPAVEAPQQLLAYDASDPDPENDARFVDLGQLDNPATAPSLLMTTIGLGPHRLATTGNDLVHIDSSRSSNAATTVVTDPEDVPRFRTIPGF